MKAMLPLAAAFLFLGAAPPDDLAPMALNSLSSAPAKITMAPVLNQDGQRVGTVKALVTDQDGRPAALSYTTPDNRLMIVAAPAASYDGQMNVIIADTSAQRTDERIAVN